MKLPWPFSITLGHYGPPVTWLISVARDEVIPCRWFWAKHCKGVWVSTVVWHISSFGYFTMENNAYLRAQDALLPATPFLDYFSFSTSPLRCYILSQGICSSHLSCCCDRMPDTDNLKGDNPYFGSRVQKCQSVGRMW